MHTRTHERTSSADGRCAGGGHGLLISKRVYSTVYLCTRAHWATHNMCDTNANILQIPCAPVANYRLLHVKRRAQLLHVALPHRIMMMDKEVARSNTRTKNTKIPIPKPNPPESNTDYELHGTDGVIVTSYVHYTLRRSSQPRFIGTHTHR